MKALRSGRLLLVLFSGLAWAGGPPGERMRQDQRGQGAGPNRAANIRPQARALFPAIEKPVHIIFTFVDHWEPDWGAAALAKAQMWSRDYGAMARQRRDADGFCPQHDWFCSNMEKAPLQVISQCVFEGLGEMNLHIHHGSSNDIGRDTTAEMAQRIDERLSFMNQVGACLTAQAAPQKAFAFIHGMWALDNSRSVSGHPEWCGCNQEIDLLLSKGCYADFTFPAWGSMQPTLMVSKIFATRDSPHPKSYDMRANVRELRVNNPPAANELVIFEGPSDPGCNPTNIDEHEAPSLSRMSIWLNYYVHLPGRNNWVFVKVYTHGSQTLSTTVGRSNLLGAVADQFYRDMELHYNDGVSFKLHYCSAREAYNIAMAAAEGVAVGEPGRYRDYKLPPPVNKFYYCDALYNLKRRDLAAGETEIQIVENPMPRSLTFWTRDFSLEDSLFEKSSAASAYAPSDAATTATLQIPLLAADQTPSEFYLFKRTSRSQVQSTAKATQEKSRPYEDTRQAPASRPTL